MPEPALEGAERHEVTFGGGMMGGMMMAMMDGRQADMREMMRSGMGWAMNGVVASGHAWSRCLRYDAAVLTCSRCTTIPPGTIRCICMAMPSV
jgi:hypothetical protein